jgi:hypothetical protein
MDKLLRGRKAEGSGNESGGSSPGHIRGKAGVAGVDPVKMPTGSEFKVKPDRNTGRPLRPEDKEVGAAERTVFRGWEGEGSDARG